MGYGKESALTPLVGAGDFITLSIPMRGGAIVDPSNVTFFIDPDQGVVTKVVEAQYIADATNSERGRATYWEDGRIVWDKIVTASGQVSDPSESASAPTGVQEVELKFNWSKFNSCLSSLGIPSWVVGAIGTACGVACAVTAGAGCAVCIAAAGGIEAGMLTHCIKKGMGRA